MKCIFKYTLRSSGRLDFAKYGCTTWRVDFKSNKLLQFLMRGENQSTQGKTSHSTEENQQALLTSCAESEIKPRPHRWKANKAINILTNQLAAFLYAVTWGYL